MKLSNIWAYPIKSLPGISLEQADLDESGLALDRRLMLVNKNGSFISQRTHKELSQFKLAYKNNSLTLGHSTCGDITFPLRAMELNQSANVEIWNDSIDAEIREAHINSWFSSILNEDVRLVQMRKQKPRKRSLPFKEEISLNFSDGYPFLVLSKASVDHTAKAIGEAISYLRFRPNLVFDDCAPFEEDKLDEFHIGSATFKMVKPCVRCQVINIDPSTGTLGKQPMKYLAKHRKQDKGVIFGMNAALLDGTHIKVSEQIEY